LTKNPYFLRDNVGLKTEKSLNKDKLIAPKCTGNNKMHRNKKWVHLLAIMNTTDSMKKLSRSLASNLSEC